MSLNKLHPRLQDHVKNKKWPDLTPIQKQSFNPVYQGKSCIIEAPTSGGKTEAVLFPLLTRISGTKSSGFKILYIAPLKALLNDLALRVIPYAKMCYVEAFKWHGDVGQNDKIKQMLFPSDILLTTPESIEAILLRKPNWREVFKDLETIVIDEAHYFALTERGSHLVSLLERVEAGIEKQPQRIAVTATVGNPNDLLSWLMGNRLGGEYIQVDRKTDKERDFKVHYFVNDGEGLQDHLYTLLVQKKSIVFERSRSNSEDTATRINERNNVSQTRFPIKVKTHHSSVSKRLREEAEESIKQHTETSINAIISTSTLELGIDIGELDQVIQIGGLNSSASFLQRVGRTGRRPDRPQYFRGLCSDEDELVLLAGCVNLGLKHVSEGILFPKKAFHILAHQVICLCLQDLGTTADHIWKIISKASCFSGIQRSELDLLISHMVQEDLLRFVNGNTLLISNKAESEFLRANWKRLFAIFDTGPMYNVVDGKKVIGTLDSGFARAQQLPFVFVLGGQEWNALKIDHEMQQISVKKNETGVAPKWKAFGNYDIPFELAQEVGLILMSNIKLDFLDLPAQRILQAYRNMHHHIYWESKKWVLESSTEYGKAYLWTFAGDKINRALYNLISSEIKGELSHDYMKVVIGLEKENPKSLHDIHDLISSFRFKNEQELQDIIEEQIHVKWFSKFSECLPAPLAQKTILEKGTDFSGLVRELNRVRISFVNAENASTLS
ncbi:ATP-dependent helicase Lhr and Lhr-like helicase [Chitinophaga rupis]|uniref:ATP-dependent helicase Lhr and Lhr-like helicase n=1 Tax=Chitinophaga rupis TaxID=573321 RepID=A0A1H8CYT0_9BACT|nr:DEAD/DEAH box helicase [Chitinophaga rupis]SEM99387.1 ATP-dependent helicase Lhr and Lhr-like helicase [Chitinophaga rupis]